MAHLPVPPLIGLMMANPADHRPLAESLQQAGYGVRSLDGASLAPGQSPGSLVIVDEASARRYGPALFDLKQQLLPLFLPMLLAVADNAQALPWLQAGFDDILRLPLHGDDLRARLAAFLRLRRHSEEMQRESTRRFHATFDLAPVGIVHMAPDGRILLANPRFCAMLGHAESELSVLTIGQLVHPEDAGDIQSSIDSLLAGRAAVAHRMDKRYCRKDGNFIWTSVAISLVRDDDGEPRYLIAAVTDISLRKQTEEALRQSERFVKSTIDALSKHICVIDAEGHILATNKAWQDFAATNGMPAATVWEGLNYLEICDTAVGMGLQNALDFAEGVRQVARGERDKFVMEYSCQPPREQRWFTAKVTRFPEGGPTRLVIMHEDTTRAKQSEQELLYLAHYDSLTGLPNRALLQDRLRQAIAHANRYGQTVWVLFLDLDRFKVVNDTLGHKAGDQLLKAIAKRLQSATRETDTVARYGGDEFIMILSESPDESLGMKILKRIMAAAAQPLVAENQEFFLTCSIGVATYPDDGQDPETLVDRADIAMYRAKELGRNGYQFYTAEMNALALKRISMERHLRNALDRDEFVLHYQPQVDLCSGQIVGLEALIRWRHPDLGMVPPASFIGLAEDTGLIVPIGAWAIRTACMQNKAWQDAGLGGLRVAVNLSARQFAQQDLVQSIAAILQESGLEARYLDIELTESIVMSDVEQAISTLRNLKALGAKLSIDDFGTGYSSLSYLSQFPIDVLKIDQSFVRGLEQHPGNPAIANAVISMAHSLGIDVIAEGVETEAQCEFLSRNMCDEIQGYWFSRPLAPEGIVALLREGRSLPPHLLRHRKTATTLLLVDDEPNIIAALKRLFRKDGYRILTASGGQEGLDVLAKNKVDVILSDQRMPGMTGVEFLCCVKERYPDTLRIVLSGFTDLQSVTDAVNEGAVYRFLLKPWDDEPLRRHVRDACRHKEMADDNRRLDMKVRSANKELAASNRRLEDALKQQQEQTAVSEATLAIMRETIHYSSLPIIGIDDDNVITLVNTAARALFAQLPPLLGADLRTALPDLYLSAGDAAETSDSSLQIAGQRFRVSWRTMGKYSSSHGKLITLNRLDTVLQDEER